MIGRKLKHFGFSHWFSGSLGMTSSIIFSPRIKGPPPDPKPNPRGAWRSDLVQVLNQEAKNFWTGRCVGQVSMVKCCLNWGGHDVDSEVCFCDYKYYYMIYCDHV